MDLMGKEVRVIKGYYKDIEGVVTGSTTDNYLLVTPESKNGFWAKAEELMLL